MTDRFFKVLIVPLTDEHDCSVIEKYAPTMINIQETIEKVYNQLYQVLRAIPNCNKVMLLGYFNVRFGHENVTWHIYLENFALEN